MSSSPTGTNSQIDWKEKHLLNLNYLQEVSAEVIKKEYMLIAVLLSFLYRFSLSNNTQ